MKTQIILIFLVVFLRKPCKNTDKTDILKFSGDGATVPEGGGGGRGGGGGGAPSPENLKISVLSVFLQGFLKKTTKNISVICVFTGFP